MKKLGNILFRFFIITILIGFTSCNKDDDGDNGNLSTKELLVGTWSVTSFDFNILVGSQSLVEYLVEVEGISASEAEVQYEIFEALLESDVSGTITFKSDNTYVSNFGDRSTSGTWSLSADEKTLTLIEGTDSTVMTINSISNTTWSATISESSPEDLDDDPQTPDVVLSVEIILTLTK
ncbi:lipocalin-like domain-containing protein [Robiginitalea sp. SC105]|uniref:lipocalin-like domain-containing protein n=1 Tax=Robiginitalea sp. SC105 TaxID=2762332 RepID=UPI00163AB907|nr:DUF4923 family protein [Robiginitalea sp. SC105]MBC2839838.1 DUF4923 family protein [Robiginitalea sp. SC105]